MSLRTLVSSVLFWITVLITCKFSLPKKSVNADYQIIVKQDRLCCKTNQIPYLIVFVADTEKTG